MLKFPHEAMLQQDPARLPPLRARTCISPEQLMAESERQLVAAVSSRNSDERLVARRLLDDALLYCRWEAEHGSILRHCVDEYHDLSPMALIAAALALVHRKGFFQFLRDHALSNRQRALLVSRIYGHSDHERLIIREHGNYLRSSASLICVGHAGTAILENAVFGVPLLEYEELYSDYFAALCSSTMAHKSDLFLVYHRSLVRSLKRRLDLRRSILLRCALSGMNAGKDLLH